MRRAAIAWVAAAGGPARGLWCLPLEGALYVVSGPGEQAAPELAGGAEGPGEATVTLRGDHGGRIVAWPAVVERVAPDGEEWAKVAPQLAGKRLNARGGAEAVVERWSRECAIHRLTPAGPPIDAGSASGAAPPRETPATRRARAPFRLHRVRRRR
ncbi:hypothetical protein [Rhizomonospora bruguierae]|uniref:hypothetical protein n=1 Tax=Rhizomonospora bruguierae TaxID=1581705 RepID=UPI001BCB06A8|nr:hypothetical protein [Micromonospora sp. NBRC 107566]